jgi:glucose uptake protein GlcU
MWYLDTECQRLLGSQALALIVAGIVITTLRNQVVSDRPDVIG